MGWAYGRGQAAVPWWSHLVSYSLHLLSDVLLDPVSLNWPLWNVPNSILSDVSIANLTFFWFSFAWTTFFHPLIVSLDMKESLEDSNIQISFLYPFSHSGFFLLEHFVHLHLKLLLICIFWSTFCKLFWGGLFLVLELFSFVLFSSMILFSCDLMTIFSVMLGIFFLCVCVYYRFLICGYHKVYI